MPERGIERPLDGRALRHERRDVAVVGRRGRKRTVIRAAIVGLGRWGQNLVASVQGKSDAIRFTAGATRTPEKSRAFADAHGFPLHDRYEKLLADPAIDAVVLATPHSLHAGQIISA